MRLLPILLLAAAALAVGAQVPAPKARHLTLVCEAVYLPARTIWVRQVRIGFDDRAVTSVQIDGVPVYSFEVDGTTLLTAMDNERIQVDTATQSWQSDFRGLAQSQGRCERAR